MSNTELSLEERTEVFNRVVSMYNGEIEMECDYILDALEDTRIRDAFIYALSDKCIIDTNTFGVSVEMSSELRVDFGQFLIHAGIVTDRPTAMLSTIIAGLALYDGDAVSANAIIDDLHNTGGQTHLSRLIEMSQALGDIQSRVWRESVEEQGSIQACLVGAS